MQKTKEEVLAMSQVHEQLLGEKLGVQAEMLNMFGHRKPGFATVLSKLKEYTEKVKVLQTGLSRKIDLGDGSFDLFLTLFQKYCDAHIEYHGVDITPEAVEFSKKICEQGLSNVELVCEDSLSYMTKLVEGTPSFDIIYLDSWDFDWKEGGPSQQHQLKEVMLADQLLKVGGLLLLDDIGLQYMGKGGLSIPWLSKTKRYELLHIGYQAAFKKLS